MSEWLPIETAPKDGTLIDIWATGADFTGRFPNCEWGALGGENTGQSDWLYDGWGLSSPADPYVPTHWMPLPKPPEAKI